MFKSTIFIIYNLEIFCNKNLIRKKYQDTPYYKIIAQKI